MPMADADLAVRVDVPGLVDVADVRADGVAGRGEAILQLRRRPVDQAVVEEVVRTQ